MPSRLLRRALPAVLVLVAASPAAPAVAAEGDPVVLSRAGLTGPPADDSSSTPVLSVDGRLAAFSTAADNLVPDDDKAVTDVVLRDNATGAIALVSRATGAAGAPANADSQLVDVTGDGRLVFFTTAATNLDPGATDGQSRTWVRDTVEGTTTLLTLGDPADGPDPLLDVSRDGRYLLVESTASTGTPAGEFPQRLVRRDRLTGETVLVSRADGPEGAPADGGDLAGGGAISADGAVVAFSSTADNLSAEDSNAVSNVFVRDLRTGTTRLVSRGANGLPADDSSFVGGISGDGRFLAVVSAARNLTPEPLGQGRNVFRWDAASGQFALASRATGPSGAASDLTQTGAASVSDDGRYVAFSSRATALSTEDSDEIETIGPRTRPQMVPENDVFVRDLATDVTSLISRAGDAGPAAESSSFAGAISAVGGLVPFSSGAGNLSTEDSNAVTNAYLRRVPPPPPPPAPPADTAAPAIADLKASRRIRPGGRLRVRFGLSEAARVRIVVERRSRGIRSGGRCRATRRRTVPKARRCTRARLVRAVTVDRPAGAVDLRVRVPRRGRRLAAGTYAVRVTATDAAGNATALTRGLRVARR